MYTFTYPRDKFDEENLNKRLILKLINKHTAFTEKLRRNKNYYLGRHDILNGSGSVKTVYNHAKDISDIATGYFMGNPIKYKNTGEADIEPLLKAFDDAMADDADSDNAINASIYGLAYEYIYPLQDSTTLVIKNLNPEHTFMVRDDTIEENELFSVYYYLRKDDGNDTAKWYAVVHTQHYRYDLVIENKDIEQPLNEEPVPHNMQDIPVIEILNNKDGIGDFEQQLGIIDAYNILMSDRIEDKEQFVDAILLLYGGSLSDEEYDENTSEETQQEKAYRKLKKSKLLELPEDAKAEYLTRTFDETGIEVLRKAIKEDIYNLSHVPNLTDENFVGNSSGVAMEYKLLGLEMLTKTKQQYYRKALRKRIKLFCNYLGLQQIIVDSNSIIPEFTRGLPKNIAEISQTIANLKDVLSQRTLMGMLPFVEDPDKEMQDAADEQAKRLQQQKELYMTGYNEGLGEE